MIYVANIVFKLAFLLRLATAENIDDLEDANFRPNVIFILADDLGYNDVPWHNNQVVAPNLKALAEGGVILEQSYVQPICSPTRSALLSGRYPFTIGRQRGVIWPLMPTGLSLSTSIMPEHLKPYGYATHAIGKWHLGFCNWRYTPTERGFDTFRGYYTGSEDYFTHQRGYQKTESCSSQVEKNSLQNEDNKEEKRAYDGYDYRNNREPYFNASNKYSAYDFTERFVDLVETRDTSQPMFVYMAFQNVHSPLQVPENYTKPYAHIKNRARRTYLGMVSAMDEAIGHMIGALKESGMYDNTVIIFSSDNGGPTITGGNNWPLRGNKSTLWEGGTRGAAFVHSPLLPNKGAISNILIHTTDWLPTIIGLAGGKPPKDTDGIDQWKAITEEAKPPRNELVYNIDSKNGQLIAGIRYKNYKLLVGDPGPGEWTPPPELVADVTAKEVKNSITIAKTTDVKRNKTNQKMLGHFMAVCKGKYHCLRSIFRRLTRRIRNLKDEEIAMWRNVLVQMKQLINKQTKSILMKQHAISKRSAIVDSRISFNASSLENNFLGSWDDVDQFINANKETIRLYNLARDPNEKFDISRTNRSVVRSLIKRILKQGGRYVEPDCPADDMKGSPRCWDGIWSPGWC